MGGSKRPPGYPLSASLPTQPCDTPNSRCIHRRNVDRACRSSPIPYIVRQTPQDQWYVRDKNKTNHSTHNRELLIPHRPPRHPAVHGRVLTPGMPEFDRISHLFSQSREVGAVEQQRTLMRPPQFNLSRLTARLDFSARQSCDFTIAHELAHVRNNHSLVKVSFLAHKCMCVTRLGDSLHLVDSLSICSLARLFVSPFWGWPVMNLQHPEYKVENGKRRGRK